MERTTTYNRIESVKYEFNEYDIKRALMAYFKIKHSPIHNVEFEMWDTTFDEGGDIVGSGGAEIIVTFEEGDDA